MKQGSTDDPFAEEPADSDDDTGADVDTPADADTGMDEPLTGGDPDPASLPDEADGAARTADRTSGDDADERGPTPENVQRGSLPYIHARDGVKDGRTQRPVFLRDHVEAGIDDLLSEMEAELGEDVYKTDVTEAAMAIAQENPELVLAKLEEWGYGWS